MGTVTPLGPNVIAAYNIASRVDAIAIAAIDSSAISATTYSGQNMGAKLYDRIIQGVNKCILFNIIFSFSLGCIVFTFSRKIMSTFVSTNEIHIIEEGIRYLNTIVLFYICGSIATIFQGVFRGLGKLSIATKSTSLQVLVRVLFSYIIVPKTGVSGIAYATGIGWFIMLIFQAPYARKIFKQISKYKPNMELEDYDIF